MTSRHRTSNFSVGGESAEADPLLQQAFFESDDYLTISSKEDRRCFLIARTGSGKSAALTRLEEVNPDHVVRIAPEDLSLPYITNLGVMRHLEELHIHLDPLFIALWKHVLLVELIRHRYKVDSPAAKVNFLNALRDKVKRDPGKRAALDYLDDFQNRFWVQTDERVREITEKFEQRIEAESRFGFTLGKSAEASTGSNLGDTSSKEVRTEQAERFQRIVNETQLARLNKMTKVLDEDILDSVQHFTYVVIDDLDRDWVDDKLENSLIRCLFRAVLDLQRVRNLKVIVALRTNIFEHLDFGTRSGGQEEKFRALVLKMRWTPLQLRDLVDERLRVASSRQGVTVTSMASVLPRTNSTRGNAMDYIVSRTLMRPRDVISFVNACFAAAEGHEYITWEHIHAAEATYSFNRTLALRDEWKPSFSGIDRVFSLFEGATTPMTRESLVRIIEDVALLLADPYFEGEQWLTEMTAPMWHSSTNDWVEWCGPLVKMLYSIGFIGCATGRRSSIKYAHEAPELLDRASNLAAVTHFNIHPAFQLGLDCRIDHSWL